MKPIRFIHYFFATLNFLSTLFFIVASFSGSVSPNKSVLFSYLGLLFPVFLLLNFCFLLYWLFARKWTMSFIMLCSFFVCWQPVTHYIPFHPFRVDVTQKKVIKVLSYNVMAFGYQDHTPANPNPIIEYIANSDADIVCLQEFMIGTEADFLTREKIESAFKMYPYHSAIPLVRKSKYSIGLAIFSKYPILSSRKIRYDSTFNGSTLHEVDVNGKKLFVLNNHLESYKLSKDDRSKYTEFFTSLNSDFFDEFKDALQKKLSTAFLIRAEQSEIIAEDIQKLDSDYLIACGDFNDTPISYAYKVVKGSMLDAFAESGTGLGITCNQNLYWFRIDHILHSPNMKAYNAQVDKISASDHYPVWCYLEMN